MWRDSVGNRIHETDEYEEDLSKVGHRELIARLMIAYDNLNQASEYITNIEKERLARMGKVALYEQMELFS